MKQPFFNAFALLVLAISAIFALPARAYLRQVAEDSIEWTVFDSDLVVRGVVNHAVDPAATVLSNHTIVTIDVLETIKGPANKTVTFLAEIGAIQRWKAGENLFFFITSQRDLARRQPTTQATVFAYPFVLRNAWMRYPIPLEDRPDRPIFDAYLRPLQTREAILAIVRNEAQHPPEKQFGMLEIHISATSENFIHPIQGNGYQPAYLNLLVDSRAEVRARDWVKSADPWDRWNGAMVLSHFQSPQNIELLTPLLDDPYKADGDWPGGSDFRWVSGTGKWRQLKSFPLRNVAYAALKNWRAAPPEAVLFEPAYAPAYLSPRTVPLLLAVAGLLMLFVLIARWIRPLRRIGGFTGLSIFLLTATAALWARSHWVIDELSFPTASKSRYEIASLDGALRIMQLEPADQPTPTTFTRIKRDPAAEANWSLAAIPQLGSIPTANVGKAGFKAQTGGMWSAGFTVQNYRAYTVPLWSLCALFALFPIFRLAIWLRRRKRHGENCCQTCGYDLRATPDRCPECGTAVGQTSAVVGD